MCRVTQYLAIDCEMNEGVDLNPACKVTIVNEKGELVIDTLIKQEEHVTKRSLEEIHGIPQEELDDAPLFSDVRDHILQICCSTSVKFVGHSVKHDLKVMGLNDFIFIDTQRTQEQLLTHSKKLKVLA